MAPGRLELYEICAHRLTDLERVAAAYRRWIKEHVEWMDETL